MSQKRIFTLALAAALTLSLCACGKQGGDTSEDNAPAGVAVQVQQVTSDTVSVENKVSAKVVADDEHTIMVASAAKCTAVYVQAGDTVKAGDIICTLDLGSTLASYSAASISYESAVASYKSQKEIFDKQIAMARSNVENTKALFAIGAASQLEIDQAELTLKQAIAGRDSTLAQLEAGIQNAKSGVSQLDMVMENVDRKGNVIAPVSGTLVSLSAVENGFVSSSMPVAVIDGADQMKVMAAVSEALVPKLNMGDRVTIRVNSADKEFSGTIRSVDQTANMQTRLYTVVINVPAEVSGLVAGMSADVTFYTDTSENTIVVPSEAILTSAGQPYVFVVEGDSAKYVAVETGLTGNGVTQITSGLVGGEQLITVGQTYLADGDPVRIVSGEG